MTEESAVSKGGSSNLLEEVTKLMVGLIIDEFILTSMEERKFCLSPNHCSPTIHCQYSYECSRGYIFFLKIWDSEERNLDMILH